MNEKLDKYFEMFNLSKAYQDRIIDIYDFYKNECPETIQDVFISEYIASDKRQFENVWFFSENYIMEAKNFIISDDFDMDIIKDNVSHWKIKKIQYDFENTTSESRMVLGILLHHRRSGLFKASEKNCDNLKEIFKNYIKPNFEISTQ
jgi:hypothetical protein